MKRKTPIQSPKSPPPVRVEGCVITNTTTPVNEHTRAAVEALALAIKVNAEAIIKVADALKGAPAHMDCGIRIGG